MTLINCDASESPQDLPHLRAMILDSGLFDSKYYSQTHPEIPDGLDPIEYYLAIGIRENHLPSLRFDPNLYLEENPDVAEAKAIPIVHYLTDGRREGRRLPTSNSHLHALFSASCLFDPEFYASYYKDVSASALDPLEHFIEFGLHGRRRPSIEFDSAEYLKQNTDVADAKIDPLEHYLRFGKQEERALPRVDFDRENFVEARKLVEASGTFQRDFYLLNSPAASATALDPIAHYLLEGHKFYSEVSPEFSLKLFILSGQYRSGRWNNPLLSYIESRTIGEKPTATFKDFDYRQWHDHTQLPEVQYERMATESFFARYNFEYAGSETSPNLARAAQNISSIRPAFDTNTSAPDVSIVIPVYGQTQYVLNCLESLADHSTKYTVEILIADDASPDHTETQLLGQIPWIRYIRSALNRGFLENCNTAVAETRGRFVVLLNSDTRPVAGWLDELIDSFQIFPKAGLVGSQLINGDGTLQEAGGVYWSDGTAHNYGRNGSYLDPRYAFARQVDWVSGAAIAVRKEIWERMEGFDARYKPAYCEDVDLAFRIREAGFEIWMQPQSRVLHFEGVTHGRDVKRGIKAYQTENLRRLNAAWRHRLDGVRPGGHEIHEEANRSIKKRMLVVDATTHTPDRDAGSVVATELMRTYAELGYHLTFVPLCDFLQRHPYTKNMQRIGIEVLYYPFVSDFSQVLDYRATFDCALVFRYNICERILPDLRERVPTCRILFSNVDLHYLRLEREAALKNDRSLRVLASRTQTEELLLMTKVDCSLVHTEDEKRVIRGELNRAPDNIVVFPWISEVQQTTVPLSQRTDIMFVGGFAHPPNVDAANFLAREIWPLVVDQLPRNSRLFIVGNAPPSSVLALQSERVIVTGYVPSVNEYLDQSKVFVAPLRFGAGIKGKLIQSLSCGVPSVATSVASEGIGLESETNYLLADDPDSIAAAILRIFHDNALAERLQKNGFDFVERHFSRARARQICEAALDVADNRWLQREEIRRSRKLEEALKDGE